MFVSTTIDTACRTFRAARTHSWGWKWPAIEINAIPGSRQCRLSVKAESRKLFVDRSVPKWSESKISPEEKPKRGDAVWHWNLNPPYYPHCPFRIFAITRTSLENDFFTIVRDESRWKQALWPKGRVLLQCRTAFIRARFLRDTRVAKRTTTTDICVIILLIPLSIS